MPVSVSNQIYVFLCSVAGGMLIAFIFDLFRIKRRTIKTSNIVTYIEDFIFWIFAALVMLLLVYYSNEGEPRGFIFIGIFLGAILYMLSLSKIIMKSVLAIIKVVCNVFKFLFNVLVYPVRIAVKIASRLIKLVCMPVKKTWIHVNKLLSKWNRFLFKLNARKKYQT